MMILEVITQFINIYLMGLYEMLGFDLVDEIENKVFKNNKRVYKNLDGINVRISDKMIQMFEKNLTFWIKYVIVNGSCGTMGVAK